MENVSEQLSGIIEINLTDENKEWLEEKMTIIISSESTKDLYLTYSILASKIDKNKRAEINNNDSDLKDYLKVKNATVLEVVRIYMLVRVLEANSTFFTPKVANIIQVADKGELETFLKFLVFLPNAGNYKHVAVDALRTNIVSVFDAIALENPYPGLFFTIQEWNQMYLKAAFMECDLSKIQDIDTKANKDLARIISDYAHERWAASREIDEFFWRPVTRFLDNELLKDMDKLFKSDNVIENKAAALCCFYSDNPVAKEYLKIYPKLLRQIEDKEISWETLKK